MSHPFKIGGALPLQKQLTPETMDAKAKAVSKMYEEYFLQQMVKAMRKTVVPADKPSFADSLYHEQLDQQYVDLWGDRGGVGLANIIYNQLKERYLDPAVVQPPKGPLPIHKDVQFKIEKPKSGAKDLTMLYEWKDGTPMRDVTSPYDSRVLQAFRTQDVGSADERQTVKLAHDNGLVSTLSFIGWARDFQPDDPNILAGEKIGLLSPAARGLTWQLGERGPVL